MLQDSLSAASIGFLVSYPSVMLNLLAFFIYPTAPEELHLYLVSLHNLVSTPINLVSSRGHPLN